MDVRAPALRSRGALTLALAAIYFAAAKLGLSMAFASEQITLVWPPSGIALAALVRFGFGIWPGITLGAFVANATADEPLLTAAGIAAGNTLEALFGAWVLARIAFDPRLERFRDAFLLVAACVVASPVPAATVGVSSLCLSGLESWSDFYGLWLVWWMGDALGILVVAPPLLAWSHWTRPVRRAQQPDRFRFTEALVLGASLASIAFLVFAGWTRGTNDQPLEYLLFPFVIWAAFRFRQLGGSLAVLLISGIAIYGTIQGSGPFATASPNQGLFLLQIFTAVLALTGLTLGAATAERDAAVNRMHENHSILKAVSEGTTDAIFVKDLEGRYLMINPAGARFLGKPIEEVLGQDDRKFFSPDIASEVMERERMLIREGRTGTFEERSPSPEMTRTFLTTKGPYRDEEGNIIGLIGISRDISELKRVEEERRELLEREKALRAAADRANRQKDEFLSLLGHELRNPLAPIRNGLEILRHDSSAKTLQWVLEVMDRQVHHLSRLVDDLLDVSRITSGRIELRPEPTDLGRVVERAIQASETFIRARGHRLEVSLPQEPFPMIADVTRLEQVIVNLLQNAARYTEPNGRIRVEVERRRGDAFVRVRDNGRGIDPELLPRIFELFTQQDRSLARSEGGLGVGLTLVRKLVELHHGGVSASSEGPGRGSEFVVRLPLVSSATAGSEKIPDIEAPAGPKLRMLVVEDNPDTARSLSFLLELLGHEVELASDGWQALEAAERLRPAVILLDIGLPGIDGYEVARRLRARGSKALLVSVTGYGRDEDKLRSSESGFDHHLVKPVELETLRKLFDSMALNV